MATAEPQEGKPAEPAADPKLLLCPECGKGFSRPQALGAHRSKAHGYRRPAPVGVAEKAVEEAKPKRKSRGWAKTGNGPARQFEVSAEITREVIWTPYEDKKQEFLPALGQEIVRRQKNGDPATPLSEAFFLLYNDSH